MTTSRFTIELGITATCLANGRAVTRFNSDLISGRRVHTRHTGNVSSSPRLSSKVALPRSGYALSSLPFSLVSPLLRRTIPLGTAPLDAATLAPRTPTHTYKLRRRRVHARTHARIHTRHADGWSSCKCNACITRTSTMMSGEFAPGGIRMYARAGNHTQYISVTTTRKESRIPRR